jgi:hypothetical protein
MIKVSLSLVAVWLFYRLALRKLTFYYWNRFYLLGYTALSFMIPFIDISSMVRKESWDSSALVQWVPVLRSTPEATLVRNDPVASFDPWYLFTLLLLSGMLLLLLRFAIQWLSFRKMVRRAELISEDEFRVYKVDENIIPFSFGRSVFINPALHSPGEIREIILHEFVHARQKHSVDIIWSEILCLVNWFNPFAWMIRRAIRQNLEFIADQKVLEHGIDRKKYQYLLLKVIGNSQFSIASKFNFSSLKKRIAMMNKMRSTGLHLLKFLFILPLVAVSLLAFRKHQSMDKTISSKAHFVAFPLADCDTVTPPVPPKAPVAPIPPKPALDALPPLAPLPPFAIVSAHCDPAKSPTPVAAGMNLITAQTNVSEFEITKASPAVMPNGTNTVHVADDRGYQITGAEDVIITISNTTSREQLHLLEKQMKEKGIELKFENVDYNDGVITSISGYMRKKGSTSNFTLTDFRQFTLAAIEKDGKVWLKVNTGDNKIVI